MFKKYQMPLLVSALVAVTLLVAIVMFSSHNSKPKMASVSDDQTSLNGTWAMGGGDKDFNMVAVVGDNSIQITMVSGDARGIYWKGTFPTGSSTVKSVADTKVLDGSMLGSSDKTKLFHIHDGEINYQFTIMGTERTIHLQKK